MSTPQALTEEMIADAISRMDARDYFGRASAQKRGRNPRWPYVPVILTHREIGVVTDHQRQILGRAYATRDDAVACAQRHIDGHRANVVASFRDPRHRAFRQQWGLPVEIADNLEPAATPAAA